MHNTLYLNLFFKILSEFIEPPPIVNNQSIETIFDNMQLFAHV